ncbi:MAG: CVNH domain-containing protein [Pseudomonadota bacterium]
MKTLTVIALGAAAALTTVAAGAWSQTPLQLPAGSYRTSCYQAHAYGGQGGVKTLTARCRTASGETRQSSLRYDDCRGDIANVGGRLTCKGSPAPGAAAPSGSYQRSCWNVSRLGPTLYATCRDGQGRPVQSSITIASCGARDIANIGGRLACAGPAGPGPTPPPAAVLYGQPGYRGASVQLRGATPTLAPWSFGDKAKSVQIRGRGRWEFCTEKNYGGRCVVLGDSVYDLGSLRMSNQISSARPVR